jgi:hypothetical protein
MKLCWPRFLLGILVLLCASPAALHAPGPPYQTDDPVPVDFQHYEFYVFGAADGTPVEMDSSVPAFEFNWGALPRLQLHAILPFGSVNPSNKPVYAPAGSGPSAFGLTDMELWGEGGLHQGIAAFPTGWNLPHVRDADRKL